VVFSKVREESGGNGHKGYVTGGELSVNGTSTDIDNVRGDTGATLVETETGTLSQFVPHTKSHSIDRYIGNNRRYLTDPFRTP